MVESFILKYFLRNEEEWQSYIIIYHDRDSQPGGKISIQTSRIEPSVPDFALEHPLGPGEFLKDLDLINLTSLDYGRCVLYIDSGEIYGTTLYSDESEWMIYLQDKDHLLPLEKITLEDGMHRAFPVMIFRKECSCNFGNSPYPPSKVTLIFSTDRMENAKFFPGEKTGIS